MIKREIDRKRKKTRKDPDQREENVFMYYMSFSVHFRFIEKNPPDFFLPVGGC
jgi:hypothetical protein